MRYTKKYVGKLFNELVNKHYPKLKYDKESTPIIVRRKNGNSYRHNFLSLDSNFIYGGHRIVIVNKKNGGERYFDEKNSHRLNNREMVCYLNGLDRGLER